MSSNRTGGAQEGSNSNNDAGEPLEEAQPVIYKVMSPAVGVNELRQRMAETMREAMWLARESRIPGMLTIQIESTGRENAISGNFRYALTNNGWENASGLPNSDVRVDFNDVRSRMAGAVTVGNAAAHVDNFFAKVASDFPDLDLTQANLCLPRAGMQSMQSVYMEYVSVESPAPMPLPSLGGASGGGIFHQQERQRQRARGETLIQDREVLALISDARTNAIMDDPVTLRDGTSVSRESVGNNLTEGRDFYPDTKLKNIIKYLKEANRADATVEQRQAALEKLEDELTDQMTGELMKDAFILKTGSVYDRQTLAGMVASGRRAHNDPNTGAPITLPTLPRDVNRDMDRLRGDIADLERQVAPVTAELGQLAQEKQRIQARDIDGEEKQRLMAELQENVDRLNAQAAPIREQMQPLRDQLDQIVTQRVSPLIGAGGGEEFVNKTVGAIAKKWPDIKASIEERIDQQQRAAVGNSNNNANANK